MEHALAEMRRDAWSMGLIVSGDPADAGSCYESFDVVAATAGFRKNRGRV